ncbi:MAG: hypothetical protein GXP32_07710 [Kiritimatiellaeota bacterium]|nr:hypothetical protein [Kiritimatiellota bacterium]
MKKIKAASLILVLCLATTTFAATYSSRERKDATKTWLKGFEYFEKADKAFQNGQLRQANTMFNMAESIFEKVALKYPKWNASLISYRIKECKRKLMEIKTELARKNIKLTDTDIDKENLELKEKIEELIEKLNKTRKELSTTLFSLEAARREAVRNVKSSNETSSLLREKNRLQKRCALLEADNKRLQQRSVSAVADKAGKQLLDKTLLGLGELKKENAALRVALAKERKEFAKLAKDRTRLQYTKKLLDDAIKNLKDQIEILNARMVEIRTATKKESAKLTDQTDEMKKMAKKIAGLQKELEKNRAKLKETRLKTSSTAIVKQLENENELLLKDLELANLHLETALKNKKITDAESRRLKSDMKKLRSSLAAMDEDRSKTTAALETLSKKLFLTSTIVKKQEAALSDWKNRYETLKKDSERLAAQYAEAAKKGESFAKLARDNERLNLKIKELKSLAEPMKKDSAKLAAKLEDSKKKLFISDSLRKKQQTMLEKNRVRISGLTKQRDELVKKYSSMDKKEKAFAELAKRSIEVESENSMLKKQIKQVRSELTTMGKESKQRELRFVRLREELKKLVSENAETNRGVLTKNKELTEKCEALSEQLAILRNLSRELKKTNKDAVRKISMLTEELVDAKLDSGKLRKQLAAVKTTSRAEKRKPATVQVKEPSMAVASGKVVALKRKNGELLSKILEMQAKLTALEKTNKNIARSSSGLSPTEKKRIEKMLDSAALAENENKKEAAIWYYEKILEDDPENQVALAKLAYVKAEKGDDEEAVKLINRALVKNPDDVELLQTLAVCYSRMKQYYKALGAAAKANAVNPRNSVTQRYLGIICSHLGWIEAAKRQFRSSFKLDPTSAETAYNAAVLLLTTKEGLQEAKLWYDKAVQLGAQPDPKIEQLFKKLEK